MTTLRPASSRFALALAALLLVPQAGLAQQARLPHGDATVTLGWLHADVSPLSGSADNWANERVAIGGLVGYYWTEHLRAEMALERSNTEHVWGSEQVMLPGSGPAFRHSDHDVQDTRLSVGQFYQFGHNNWTHAFVGGGVSMTWREVHSIVAPLQRYEQRGSVILEPGYERSSTESRTNAFVALGLKAYMTPRAFFRSDIQADFRGSLDAIVMRAGVGVDF